MDDLVAEFLTETNESLAELDNDLVALEQNPNDTELLGKIFRLVHTIKGTCGFLGLPRLERVAHHGENVLGRFRDGDLEVTPDYMTAIFECMDRIRMIVEGIEKAGNEPEGDDVPLIQKLDAIYEGKAVPTASTLAPETPKEEKITGMATEEELEAAFQAAPGPDDLAQEEERVTGMATEEELEAAFQAAPGPDDLAPPKVPEVEEVAKTPAASAKQAEEDRTEKKDIPVSAQSLRVNVEVLEDLMTMVSELVLTRNQLLQILRSQGETEFSGPLQRLNHVVSDLQEGVMKTRMQPIGNAWAKLPRIIRDLSMELNKKIDLEMIGQDTELDRQVLELIKDPLTHMVRNSADHGIEDPATRVAAGKKEVGKVVLNAFHEGGHIIIEIKDDGKGLAADKIKKKAIESGLATETELAQMTSLQIQQFIFRPGFSTAEKVTSVSGRGVGMDVVRTNIEKIGGSIDLKSIEDKGSTFTIKIPLTLAIVSALIVESSQERFAIPQLSVRELVMTSEHAENQIETIKGTPVLRLRDKLLPLVSLSNLLELHMSPQTAAAKDAALQELRREHEADMDLAAREVEKQAEEKSHLSVVGEEDQKRESASAEPHSDIAPLSGTTEKETSNQYIVVTQVGNYDFGIIVDRVFDTEEIVVKPVAQILRDIEIFSGNTILGDGSVIMILDPNGIARATGEIESDDRNSSEEDAAMIRSGSQNKTSLLLFRVGDNTPKAVPLSLVSRLENVELDKIEHSSGKMMVQYRDQLMPLVKFDEAMRFGEEKEKPVLVFADQAQSLGLIVDEIIDITEEHIDVQITGQKNGLLGSAIINERATDVVDVAHYLNANTEDWFKGRSNEIFGESNTASGKRHVLLVDDSPFFRNMLTPLLNVAGYHVTTAENPLDALKMCEQGAKFDIIVSDIEMPEMDGFEFAQKIKEGSNWQNTPLVALTSHANPKDIDRGMNVGFNKYIAKFDRDTLLNTISQTLSEQNNEADDDQRGEAV